MTRPTIQPSREVLPPSIPYAGTVGGLAVVALGLSLTWLWHNPGYVCAGMRGACDERERQIQAPLMATVVLPAPTPRLSLQLPPAPQDGWRKAEDGCPPHYYPINGACWIGVEEPPPCPTSYHYRGKCYAPAPAPPKRDGVSSPFGDRP